MPNETPATTPASDEIDPSRRGVYSLDSFWARFIPPAAIGLAWWLSGIELVETCEHETNWRILAVAFSVFWLAACGSQLVIRRPREAIWLATTLALVGLLCGWLSSRAGSYLSHVFYSATHALIIGSLGLLAFVTMTRGLTSQTSNKPKGVAVGAVPVKKKEPVTPAKIQS
jgi:hypothetical protein